MASDVGCLVSDFEGLPVFMLECLQAGRPFLGTDVGDMGEVLRRTGAGVVVDRPGRPGFVGGGVRQLADTDEWSRMARLAVDSAALFDPSRLRGRLRCGLRGEATMSRQPITAGFGPLSGSTASAGAGRCDGCAASASVTAHRFRALGG